MTGTTDFPAEEILQLTPQAGSWLRGEAESRGQSAAEVLGSLVEERAASAPAPPLSPDQLAQYRRDGYLLVSGLIPDDAAARAEEAMWRCIGCDPDNPPSSWEEVPGDLRLYNDPDLKNCFTPDVLAAAAQITGDDLSTFSKSDTHPKTWHTATYLEAEAAGEDLSRFYRWDCAYAINIMPGKGDGGDHPHIDHSMGDHHHRTFPPVFRLGTLIFLNDVAPNGGGTRVWPGSHRVFEELARRSPRRYEWRSAFMEDMAGIDPGKPLSLTISRGDVLFLHHLLAHAGSFNAGDRPRFALNMKW